MFKTIKVSFVALLLTINQAEAIAVEHKHHRKHHHHPNHELVQSDPICSSAGCTQYNHPKSPSAAQIPRDYFVPNFGEDNDVKSTKKHILDQEAVFGQWNLQNVTKIDRDYKVPNFGIDSDIIAAQASIKSSEA